MADAGTQAVKHLSVSESLSATDANTASVALRLPRSVGRHGRTSLHYMQTFLPAAAWIRAASIMCSVSPMLNVDVQNRASLGAAEHRCRSDGRALVTPAMAAAARSWINVMNWRTAAGFTKSTLLTCCPRKP